MNAAWAQAWLSGLAIIASGAFAVLVPALEQRQRERRENRKRLAVTTTRSAPAGLAVDITYLPEFTHIGLFARVKLTAPPEATLQGRKGGRRTNAVGGQFIDRIGTMRLVRLDNERGFSGSLLILPAAETPAIIQSAHVQVEIFTDAKVRLLRVAMHVTPIDESKSYWEE